jgi:hypothetical protein
MLALLALRKCGSAQTSLLSVPAALDSWRMDPWKHVAQQLHERAAESDDLTLWRSVIETVCLHADALAQKGKPRRPMIARIARSSHWRRSQMCRWEGSKLVAPPDFGRDGFTISGAPRHDTEGPFCNLEWFPDGDGWVAITEGAHKRRQLLILELVVPARTQHRKRVAVFVRWLPGSPQQPKKEAHLLYGFRKLAGGWSCADVIDPQR